MKENKDAKANQVGTISQPAWPYVLLISTPLFVWPLSQYLHVSLLVAPFLIMLTWLPFLFMEYVRRCRAASQEKQALQAKFDAQDAALFGDKYNPR